MRDGFNGFQTSIKNELDDLPTLYSIDLCKYATIENAELKEHIDRVGKSFWLNR